MVWAPARAKPLRCIGFVKNFDLVTRCVVSIPDADALGKSIQAAVKAGIPVISMNSGSNVSKKLGCLMHVGQEEYDSGKAAGERMKAEGVKKALCVNPEVGNVGLD